MRSLLLIPMLVLWGCPKSASCPATLHTDPAQLRESHRALHTKLVSIRAEARVDKRGGGGSQDRLRGTVMMLLKRPSHVRFDIMTQFGPAAILTSDSERFQLNDMQQNRYLTGPACPSNIKSFLGIAMSSADVSRLLIGEAPLIEAQEESVSCGEDGYEVVRRGPTQIQTLVYTVRPFDLSHPPRDFDVPENSQHLRLASATVRDLEGNEMWRATYDDYRIVTDPLDTAEPKRGIALPFRVSFQEAGSEADVLVKIKELDINVEVEPATFTQVPTPGLSISEVACQ